MFLNGSSKYKCLETVIMMSTWFANLRYFNRWFVYDTVSHMSFGRNPGFVKNGKDVEGLIQAFHDMAPMAGLVAALPHLVNPVLNSSIFGWYLMPTAGDGTGIGKVMQVKFFLVWTWHQAYFAVFSLEITCYEIVWKIVIRRRMVISWTSCSPSSSTK